MLLDILEGTFFTFEFDLRGSRAFLGVSRLENHEIAGPRGWVWAVDFSLFRGRPVHDFIVQLADLLDLQPRSGGKAKATSSSPTKAPVEIMTWI